MGVVHRGQCHTRLIIDFTLTDIRTVQHVVVIVESHQPILLLPYLILLEVRTAFALVSLHLAPYITALVLHQVRLSNIRIARRIGRVKALAHTIILRHIPPLLGGTTLDSISIILLALCAILRI